MAFEAGGKVASEALGIFKSQPMVLALIILSFALIGLLYLQSVQFTSQRRENVALFVKVQSDVQRLLAQCIVPPPPPQRSELKLGTATATPKQ